MAEVVYGTMGNLDGHLAPSVGWLSRVRRMATGVPWGQVETGGLVVGRPQVGVHDIVRNAA
jgi:hypothetical protein